MKWNNFSEVGKNRSIHLYIVLDIADELKNDKEIVLVAVQQG